MLNLKKTAVAVLALGSSAVFAGTMGPVCVPGNVTVPCEAPAWMFGVQALYLQYVYDVGNVTLASTANSGNTVYQDHNAKYGWGFKLEGAYMFSTGNDLNVNWYHYKKSTNDSFYGSSLVYNNNIGDPATVSRSSAPSWDAVNVEFGQHADFGEFKDIRFHGGVQFARVKHNISAYAVDAAGLYESGNIYGRFNGFGPRLGLDYIYNFNNGFGVYAKGATALLVGNAKHSANEAYIAQVGGAVTTASWYSSPLRMVPDIELKLGLTYDFAMAQGDLGIDLGWMWVEYIDPLAFWNGRDLNKVNFSLQGPFVGLKWVGNI